MSPCILRSACPLCRPSVLHWRLIGHQQRHGTGQTWRAERDLVDDELYHEVDISRLLLGPVRLLNRRQPPLPFRLPPRVLLHRLGQTDRCLVGVEQDMR